MCVCVLYYTALQQLDQLTSGEALTPHNFSLSLVVASLNALLWIIMIIFAFVQVLLCTHTCTLLKKKEACNFYFIQASRVTGAGLQLRNSGVHIRSRPFQYTNTPQSELDSFVLYMHALKLKVSHWPPPNHY